MTLRELHNSLAILRSIDAHELPSDWSNGAKERFLRDPYEFFLRADDYRQRALFSIVLRRMKSAA